MDPLRSRYALRSGRVRITERKLRHLVKVTRAHKTWGNLSPLDAMDEKLRLKVQISREADDNKRHLL